MENIKKKFATYLNDPVYPTEEQEKKEMWNISGILKNHSNQHLKFDIRPMFKLATGQPAKEGKTTSKADKIVFEDVDKWIIVDMKELIKYIKRKKQNRLELVDLLDELDWNIILPKEANGN
jgi:hypothetical protein